MSEFILPPLEDEVVVEEIKEEKKIEHPYAANPEKVKVELKYYTMTAFIFDILRRDYPLNNNNNEKYECSVCYEELQFGDKMAEFLCPGKHIFHENCILQWLRVNNNCALCRHEIETVNPEYNKILNKRKMRQQRNADYKKYILHGT